MFSPSRFRKPRAGARINHAHPLAYGLVAAYLFNEQAGATLIDSSPYDARPTFTGFDWRADGAAFDGSTSLIDLGTPSRLDLTGPFSLEAIFVLSSQVNTVYPRLISNLSNSPYNGYELLIAAPDGSPASRVYMQVGNAGTLSLCYGGSITTGVEYHVIATYDGSAPIIYVNGASAIFSVINFGASAVGSSSSNVNIGRWPGTTSMYFPGVVKKAAVYNRVLDAGEVAHLYTDPYAYIYAPRRIIFDIGGNQTVSLTGVASEETWGTAALYRQNELYPLGIPSEEAWGTASLAQTVTLTLTGIASEEAWGTAALVDPTATQTITLTGIASAEAWGANTLTRGGTQTIVATGIPTEEAWGLPALSVAGTTYQGVKIFLDGTEYADVSTKKAVSIHHRLGARGDASFTLIHKTQTVRPGILQYVEITENRSRVFSGFIDDITEEREDNTLPSFVVKCSDLIWITDRRLVTAEYAPGSVRSIVLDIWAKFLDGESLTTFQVFSSSTTTQTLRFKNETVTSAFTKIAAVSGDVWWITPYRDILFCKPATIASPQSVTSTSANYRDMKVKITGRGFANSVVAVSEANLA